MAKLAEEFFIVIGILVVIGVIALAVVNFFKPTGMVEVNVIRVLDNSIMIGNNCTAIIADTSPERADSIQLGLDKKISGRPNTHDTFAAVLKGFNITLEAVEITNYDKQFYYSNMIFSSGNQVVKLETLPSDGIAVALRTGSKVYINQTLLSEQGRNIC